MWLINLDQTVGSEIKKIRPAIVVNDNALGKLPFKVIVPLTDWKDQYDIAPWMVKLLPDRNNNLSKPSAADCFQVRSLSELRFTKKLGKITTKQLEEIKAGLAKFFSIEA